jgi:nucleotide-binding universal stress UspA family protein
MKKDSAAPSFVFPPRTICCAVDTQQSSKAAARFAAQLSQKFQSQISYLSVDTSLMYQAELLESGGALAIPAINPEQQKEFLVSRDAETRAFLAECVPNLKYQLQILSGDPALAISTHVRKNTYDLLVVGRKHKTLLENFFLGSTANNLLEDAQIPVAVVPEGCKTVDETPVEIILATDMQTKDMNAPRAASQLSRSYSAATTLLHAYEAQDYRPIPRDYFSNADIYDEISELFQNAHEIKRSGLEREAAHLSERFEFPCVPKLLEGPIRSSLLRYIAEAAEKKSPQYLILGRFTNRSSFGTWLLGSTARTVAMNAECPVFVIPHDADEA